MNILASYLKIAWRHLWKNKTHTAINILGLSAGMAVALLIGIWVWDELSFNHYYRNHHRIAEILSIGHFNGAVDGGPYSSVPLAAELRSRYSADFSRMALVSWTSITLSTPAKSLRQYGAWAQADYPRMFSLQMIDGSADALSNPSCVLLSATLARALFGTTAVTGDAVTSGDTLVLKIGGVYADPPDNVSLSPQFLVSWENNANPGKLLTSNWTDHHYQLYVQIPDHATFEDISARIKDIAKPHLLGGWEEIALFPMDRWRLWDRFENGKPTGGRLESVWLCGIIGFFVLLLACINFMNLSTAKSEKRARETGVRKVLGSMRYQLIGQFLGESLLVTFIAMAAALLLAQLALPAYNRLCDKRLFIPYGSPLFWLVMLGFTFMTGLIAGSYPAFYLSKFNPVRVLKGSFRAGRFASLPRRMLVTLQFTISVSLIIGAVMVFRQVQFAKSRPVGYSEAGLITMDVNMPDLQQHFDALRQELLSTGAIVDMAASSSPTTNVNNSMLGYDWEGRDARSATAIGTLFVSYDFGKTVGWTIKEGRDFSRDHPADSGAFIVNEAAARYMGLTHPVGKYIRWHQVDNRIIGVVRDMVMESPYQRVAPAFFTLRANQRIHYLLLRLNPALAMQTALARIEPVMRKYDPANPFGYSFTDETYGAKFREEEQTGRLTTLFAVLAVFISCLGLSGLAAFVAEQRTREIGVRKVLGASVYSLWKTLSSEFAVLVAAASLIAIPLTVWLLRAWLQHYTYRASLAWWIFPLAALGTLIVTLLTVSYQTVRAALADPVKSLKME